MGMDGIGSRSQSDEGLGVLLKDLLDEGTILGKEDRVKKGQLAHVRPGIQRPLVNCGSSWI